MSGELTCDHDGKVSSMRIAFLSVVCLVVVSWLLFSVAAGEMVEIPGSVVSLVISAFGGKVGQTFLERK